MNKKQNININEYKAIINIIGTEYNQLIQNYYDRLCSDEPYITLTKTKEQHIQQYKKEIEQKAGIKIFPQEK